MTGEREPKRPDDPAAAVGEPLRRKAQRRLGIGILFLAVLCFGFGLSLPIVELKRFFVFEDGYSILTLIGTLLSAEERFLAAIVFVFAVLIPILKFVVLGVVLSRAAVSGRARRLATVLDAIGKWSMLDVLIVAILVVAVKVSGLQAAATQPGLYFFAGAVILTGAASWIVKRIL